MTCCNPSTCCPGCGSQIASGSGRTGSTLNFVPVSGCGVSAGATGLISVTGCGVLMSPPPVVVNAAGCGLPFGQNEYFVIYGCGLPIGQDVTPHEEIDVIGCGVLVGIETQTLFAEHGCGQT